MQSPRSEEILGSRAQDWHFAGGGGHQHRAHLLHSSSTISTSVEQPRIGPAAAAVLSWSQQRPAAAGKRCRGNARTEQDGSDLRVKEASIRFPAA